MTLDPVTAYSIAALLSSVACVMMVWMGHGSAWPNGIRFWGLGCAAGVFSFLGTVLRSVWQAPLMDLITSTCAVLAWVLFWAGMRHLRGVERPAVVTLLVPVWLVMGAILLHLVGLTTALGIFTSVMAVLGICTALEAVLAWRRGPAPGSILLLALLAFCYSGTQGMRARDAFGGDPTLLPQGLHLLLIVCLPIAFVFVAVVVLMGHMKGQEVAAIQSARERMDRLLAALPAVIFQADVDTEGRATFRYCGGDAEGVTGWPLPQPEDLAHRAPLLGDDPARLAEFFTGILQQGRAELDWQVRQPDGNWRWVRCHGRLISRHPDGGGEVVGSILDQTMERMADARAIVAARLASVGELAAGLAHDIKQPLQAVSLLAENTQVALQAGAGRLDPAALHGSLEDILQQTARADAVVEHLRAFARSESSPQLNADVDLPQAIDCALMLTGGTLQQAKVTVCIDAAADLPQVRVNLMRLEQVLVMLLTNACDALALSAPGQPRRITISARVDGPGAPVRLLLEDNGGGIAPVLLGRLFTPFVTTKGPEQGAGLGLYVCQRLLADMGGEIVARNGTHGAIFDLLLPPAVGRNPGPAAAAAAA